MRSVQLIERSPGLHVPHTLRVLGVLLLVCACVAAASYFGVRATMTGSKTQLISSVFFALLPLLLYFSMARPFIFPFALFVLAVPIDNLLGVNMLSSQAATSSTEHVATITKYLGLASGLAFVFWLVRRQQFVRPPAAVFLWLGLLVWMALSTFWAIDANVAVTQLLTYLELIILFVAISLMPITRLELQVFIGAVVLGAVATAAYSIYQYHEEGGVLHTAINQVLVYNPRLRAEAAEIDPNEMTASLMLPIAIVLMGFLQRKWSFAKLGFGAALLVLLGGVYVTASRGGIIGLVALLCYLIIRSRYRMQIIALSLLAASATLIGGLSSGSLVGRFMDAARTGGSGRTSVWLVGWDAFKHHWLLGAGVGNFSTAYAQSFIHIFESVYMGWKRVSHNTPLGIAVELGAIGLVFASAAAFAQYRMLNVIRRSDPLYDFRIALEAGFVGLGVASVFLWVLPAKYPWLLFELMAAVRAFAICRTAGMTQSIQAPVRLWVGEYQGARHTRVPTSA